MQGAYDRIVWTVIALSLSLIALSPGEDPGAGGHCESGYNKVPGGFHSQGQSDTG